LSLMSQCSALLEILKTASAHNRTPSQTPCMQAGMFSAHHSMSHASISLDLVLCRAKFVMMLSHD